MAQPTTPMPEGTDAIIEGAGAGNGGGAETGELAYEVDSDPDGEPSAGGTGSTSAGASQAAGSSSGSGASQGDGAKPQSTAGSSGAAGGGGEAAASWADGGGALFERFAEIKSQGYDQARTYAVQGKDKATGAIDEVLRLVEDAASQIDGAVGNQYGDYARRAASGLADLNESLKGKDVDELFQEARALIARAPAVAVGTAAALGFVVARLARAGLEPADTAGSTKPKA